MLNQITNVFLLLHYNEYKNRVRLFKGCNEIRFNLREEVFLPDPIMSYRANFDFNFDFKIVRLRVHLYSSTSVP